MKYYSIYIWCGVQSTLLGPYTSARKRLKAARRLWNMDARQVYDGIFKLDVDEVGELAVAGYTAVEVDDRVEADCEERPNEARFVPLEMVWVMNQRSQMRTYYWSGGDLTTDKERTQERDRLYNICIWDGHQIQLFGPYASDEERLTAAQQFCWEVGDQKYDSIFRLDIDADGVPDLYDYAGCELSEPDQDQHVERHVGKVR